jgi:uncharacterized protein (TIGR03083 family)
MDTWTRVDAERAALHDDLAGLDAAQWDVQSLCSRWKVRHVVAHLIGATQVKAGSYLVAMLKAGMNLDRAIARAALSVGAAPPEELLLRFKDIIGKRSLPPGVKPAALLNDTVCHAADIRRPLGLSRVVPDETLVEAANLATSVGFPLGAKKRIAGLRLVANDTSWSTGEGPTIEGPLESLILVMTGRSSALVDLSGDGLVTLRNRN